MMFKNRTLSKLIIRGVLLLALSAGTYWFVHMGKVTLTKIAFIVIQAAAYTLLGLAQQKFAKESRELFYILIGQLVLMISRLNICRFYQV